MRLHAVTSTFILCKPEVVGSIPIVSTMYMHGPGVAPPVRFSLSDNLYCNTIS